MHAVYVVLGPERGSLGLLACSIGVIIEVFLEKAAGESSAARTQVVIYRPYSCSSMLVCLLHNIGT